MSKINHPCRRWFLYRLLWGFNEWTGLLDLGWSSSYNLKSLKKINCFPFHYKAMYVMEYFKNVVISFPLKEKMSKLGTQTIFWLSTGSTGIRMPRFLSFHGFMNPNGTTFLLLCHSLTHSLISICFYKKTKKALKFDLHASVASSLGLRTLITSLINW